MPTEVPVPSCPPTYIFNRESCVCSPKKPVLKKLVLKKVKHKEKLCLTAKPRSRSSTPKKLTVKKLQRCPNGTRRNKKTGECVGKNGTAKKAKDKPKDKAKEKPKDKPKDKAKPKAKEEKLITVKNTTPLDDRLIGDAISRTLKASPTKKPATFMELLANVRQDLIRSKSFSPSVNKRLVSLRDVKNSNIFGCRLEDVLHGKTGPTPKNLKIKIGVSARGNPICVSYKTDEAKKLMLNNLAASKSFACGKVVAPLQLQTNCWFNTMYMVFFVSDKGRKFFRFLRQLMIEGRQEKGYVIKPQKLAQAFFLFNAYIESSYNLDDSAKTITAEGMDTNVLISSIYNSIPKKYKKGSGSGFRGPGSYGNPLQFYQSIIHYLWNDSLMLYDVEPLDIAPFLEPSHRYTDEYYMPDVIVIKTYDNVPMFKDKVLSESVTTQQLEFTRIYDGEYLPKGKSKEAKYVLDSAIVRSTNQEHFCALITCNGEEMAFDGGSLSRLGGLEWKSYLNKPVSWTFEDSQGKISDLRWNFMSSYQLLYYYRA